jgi:signal transduction histidine kinase
LVLHNALKFTDAVIAPDHSDRKGTHQNGSVENSGDGGSSLSTSSESSVSAISQATCIQHSCSGVAVIISDSSQPRFLHHDEIRSFHRSKSLLSPLDSNEKVEEFASSPESPEAPNAMVPIQIHVLDTGIGMTHQQLHSVFEAFASSKLSISRSRGGHGLGNF